MSLFQTEKVLVRIEKRDYNMLLTPQADNAIVVQQQKTIDGRVSITKLARKLANNCDLLYCARLGTSKFDNLQKEVDDLSNAHLELLRATSNTLDIIKLGATELQQYMVHLYSVLMKQDFEEAYKYLEKIGEKTQLLSNKCLDLRTLCENIALQVRDLEMKVNKEMDVQRDLKEDLRKRLEESQIQAGAISARIDKLNKELEIYATKAQQLHDESVQAHERAEQEDFWMSIVDAFAFFFTGRTVSKKHDTKDDLDMQVVLEDRKKLETHHKQVTSELSELDTEIEPLKQKCEQRNKVRADIQVSLDKVKAENQKSSSSSINTSSDFVSNIELRISALEEQLKIATQEFSEVDSKRQGLCTKKQTLSEALTKSQQEITANSEMLTRVSSDFRAREQQLLAQEKYYRDLRLQVQQEEVAQSKLLQKTLHDTSFQQSGVTDLEIALTCLRITNNALKATESNLMELCCFWGVLARFCCNASAKILKSRSRLIGDASKFVYFVKNNNDFKKNFYISCCGWVALRNISKTFTDNLSVTIEHSSKLAITHHTSTAALNEVRRVSQELELSLEQDLSKDVACTA